ncbi:unnamed protein product, partial [Iphiclides podalirius]
MDLRRTGYSVENDIASIERDTSKKLCGQPANSRSSRAAASGKNRVGRIAEASVRPRYKLFPRTRVCINSGPG